MTSILVAYTLMIGSALATNQPAKPIEQPLLEKEEEELADLLESMPRETVDQMIDFLSLDWKGPGTYQLNQSKSVLSVPEGYQLLLEDEANKALAIDKDPPRENLEALVYTDNFQSAILFESCKTGYVSLDDWEDLDAAQLLQSVRENTNKANQKRRQNGGHEIHVIGWIQEPTLDRQTNTVFWAIEGIDSGTDENIINSVALRLGREGFERVTWIMEKPAYSPFGGELDIMLRAHSFDPGHRYTDYTKGDKIAGYGIASLVAATIGAKIIKAGGFLVLLKKFGGFIAAGVAALSYKMRNVFRRKNKQ